MALGQVDDAEFQAWANRVKSKVDRGYLKKELSTSIKRIGVQALRQFKANTPVDTGQLRRSWTAQDAGYGGGWTIELRNNTEYASYVEDGHRIVRGGNTYGWVPGQFFMKKSLNQVNAQLPSLITPGLWAFRGLFD